MLCPAYKTHTGHHLFIARLTGRGDGVPVSGIGVPSSNASPPVTCNGQLTTDNDFACESISYAPPLCSGWFLPGGSAAGPSERPQLLPPQKNLPEAGKVFLGYRRFSKKPDQREIKAVWQKRVAGIHPEGIIVYPCVGYRNIA